MANIKIDKEFVKQKFILEKNIANCELEFCKKCVELNLDGSLIIPTALYSILKVACVNAKLALKGEAKEFLLTAIPKICEMLDNEDKD